MKSIFLNLALICLVFVSCKKDIPSVVGCMDENATNYNSEANSAGNCSYTNSVVFWFDTAIYSELISNGVTTLTFYADGVIIGYLNTNQYSVNVPNCQTTNNVIRYTNNYQNYNVLTYHIEDQNGDFVYGGNIYINPGDCIVYKIDE